MMKTKSILTLILSASLVTLGIADDKKTDAKKGHDHEEKGDDHHAAAEAPKTAKEIWNQLNGLEDAVNAAVTKNDAHGVHDRAAQATALLKALPEKSTGLSAIAKKRVTGYTNSLAKLLDAAHDAADEKKFDVAAKSMKSYAGLAKTLKAQYDKDTTSGKTAEKDLPKVAEEKGDHKH